MEQLLYTVSEAADRLRLSRAYLYTLVMSGAIESIKLGRSRRIPSEALSAFVDGLRAEGGDAA